VRHLRSRKVASLQSYIEEEADRKVDALIAKRVEQELEKQMKDIDQRVRERVERYTADLG
jgi:hypothetical protein